MKKPKCPKCKSKNVVTLSCGTILCKNPKCLSISIRSHNQVTQPVMSEQVLVPSVLNPEFSSNPGDLLGAPIQGVSPASNVGVEGIDLPLTPLDIPTIKSPKGRRHKNG
jgi:hypothetical protein